MRKVLETNSLMFKSTYFLVPIIRTDSNQFDFSSASVVMDHSLVMQSLSPLTRTQAQPF